MEDDADVIDEGEFFMELNEGRTFTDITRDKKTVKLTLQSPSVEDVRKARKIIDEYRQSNGDISQNSVRAEVVQIACCGCIKDVTEENVMAFIGRFHRDSKVIIECLKIIDIDGPDLEYIGIDVNRIKNNDDYNDEIPF